jgi:NADPH:quinone reductase-like Zn-dependent oxidoreductase
MTPDPDDSTALPNTMQAMVRDTYGEAEDVLRLEEIAVPEVADDRVLLRVHAAGVDRGVWHLTAGLPYPVRLAGFGVRAPKNRVPGLDVAGTVVVVGSKVTGLAPGDEVYGVAEGSFAEYATARPDKLAPKPSNLTFEQTAAVAISGLTALQALRDHAKVQPGQKVLILGASGGVGSYAVQIAKAFGAEVTGVCSTAKLDLVRALGADHVIDYTVTDLADDPQRYDVILDIGGNRSLSVLRRSLTPRGTLVVAGGETGGRWLGGYDRLLRASALSPFVSQKLGTFVSSENREDLLVLTELIESGQVTPAVDRIYPLREAAAAMRHMLDGHARGKVVITLSEGPPS